MTKVDKKEIDKDFFFVDNMKLEKPRKPEFSKFKKKDFRIQIYIIIAMAIACGLAVFLFIYKPLLLWRIFSAIAIALFAFVIVMASLKFPKMKKFNNFVDCKLVKYEEDFEKYNQEYERVENLYEKECGIVKE